MQFFYADTPPCPVDKSGKRYKDRSDTCGGAYQWRSANDVKMRAVIAFFRLRSPVPWPPTLAGIRNVVSFCFEYSKLCRPLEKRDQRLIRAPCRRELGTFVERGIENKFVYCSTLLVATREIGIKDGDDLLTPFVHVSHYALVLLIIRSGLYSFDVCSFCKNIKYWEYGFVWLFDCNSCGW